MKNRFVSLLALLSIALTSASAHAEKVIRYPIIAEPPQLNGMKSTDNYSFMVLGHIMEGLTRTDDSGATKPAIAESWNLSDKGVTFKLRKNAKWSDGKTVTAKDFVFAWRTVVDPKTASEYAYILFPVKNAEAIVQGKKKPSELAVSAPDDFTLKVEFEKPCAYFLALTSFATYFPVREDIYAKFGQKYGADHDKMVYNGPFMLTSWVHGSSLKMSKNPQYWNSASVKLDAVEIPYITPDNNARFNFFKDKKVDMLENMGKDDLPKANAEGFKLRSFSDGTLYFLEFNFRPGRAINNLNLRKALVALFNPSEYVQKVVSIPGTQPGRGLIPSWMKGEKKKFRDEFKLEARKPDLAAAKKYIEAAKKELGGSIPPLVFLTGDTPLTAREAEYFQELWKRQLGVEIKIDKQIFKQRLAKMLSGEFDIVSAGWGPDFNDPMTFAELTASWNENNRGKYNNPKADEMIKKAQATTNQKVRMDAMAQAEKLALDDVAYMPLYERSIMWTARDHVQGVIRRQLAPDPDFTQAYIKE